MPLTGLVVVVAGTDRERASAALAIAAAAAATGAAVRLYLHDAAVGLLDDACYRAALDEVMALGGQVIACGSALADGLGAARDPRVETGGLVGLMSSLGEDRLLVV